MGRKRNKGKARREAKAKARDEAEANISEKSLLFAVQSGLMLQLPIDGIKCCHATIPASPDRVRIGGFVVEFYDAFRDAVGKRVLMPLSECFMTAKFATDDKFADVWNDSDKLEIAMSLFLNSGTEVFLDGEFIYAQMFATCARFFEQYIATVLKQTQAVINSSKTFETMVADEHTLVKFFRHRISCSCLDQKYEEVKHITKKGYCFNPRCPIPEGGVERSKATCCSRCRNVTYCSRECQVANWSEHKPDCDRAAALIAEFEAKNSKEASVSIA